MNARWRAFFATIRMRVGVRQLLCLFLFNNCASSPTMYTPAVFFCGNLTSLCSSYTLHASAPFKLQCSQHCSLNRFDTGISSILFMFAAFRSQRLAKQKKNITTQTKTQKMWLSLIQHLQRSPQTQMCARSFANEWARSLPLISSNSSSSAYPRLVLLS